MVKTATVLEPLPFARDLPDLLLIVPVEAAGATVVAGAVPPVAAVELDPLAPVDDPVVAVPVLGLAPVLPAAGVPVDSVEPAAVPVAPVVLPVPVTVDEVDEVVPEVPSLPVVVPVPALDEPVVVTVVVDPEPAGLPPPMARYRSSGSSFSVSGGTATWWRECRTAMPDEAAVDDPVPAPPAVLVAAD